MNSLKLPQVSIIIPVFNDIKCLETCLTALAKQTYPEDSYEVIVVDNGSSENIDNSILKFKNVRLIYESQPGSYIARNRGVEVAKGEILAFTDADCIPEPDWLKNGVAALLSEPNIGMVAGHIELFVENAGFPNSFELYETVALAFPQDQFLANDQFGVTANLITFKHVMDAVGKFDETLKSGGDRQWGKRVFAAGYKQVYAEDAQVNHPARNNWEALYKRAIRIIGGQFDMLKANKHSSIYLLIDFILFLKPPFRFFIRTWQDQRLQGIKQKLQFTDIMLRLRWASIKERFRLQFKGGISERS